MIVLLLRDSDRLMVFVVFVVVGETGTSENVLKAIVLGINLRSID
jgi:hypothetical protein